MNDLDCISFETLCIYHFIVYMENRPHVIDWVSICLIRFDADAVSEYCPYRSVKITA